MYRLSFQLVLLTVAGKKHGIKENSFVWAENYFLLAGIKSFPKKMGHKFQRRLSLVEKDIK